MCKMQDLARCKMPGKMQDQPFLQSWLAPYSCQFRHIHTCLLYYCSSPYMSDMCTYVSKAVTGGVTPVVTDNSGTVAMIHRL